MEGRCEVVDGQMGRCVLDADGHTFAGVHAYEKVPGPPGPPQKWQTRGGACGRGPCSASDGHEGSCSDASGWGVEAWRDAWEHTDEQLRLAIKREAEWGQKWQKASDEAREFARQARAGERLRVAVRSLEQNASAGLIHWSGEAADVVRAEDLRVALDGVRGQ